MNMGGVDKLTYKNEYNEHITLLIISLVKFVVSVALVYLLFDE